MSLKITKRDGSVVYYNINNIKEAKAKWINFIYA